MTYTLKDEKVISTLNLYCHCFFILARQRPNKLIQNPEYMIGCVKMCLSERGLQQIVNGFDSNWTLGFKYSTCISCTPFLCQETLWLQEVHCTTWRLSRINLQNCFDSVVINLEGETQHATINIGPDRCQNAENIDGIVNIMTNKTYSPLQILVRR